MSDFWYLADYNTKAVDACLVDFTLTALNDRAHLLVSKSGAESFMISDNGGELNFGKLNGEFERADVSMPLPVRGKQANAEVVAYRIMQWVSGQEIDYGYDGVMSQDECLQAAGC